MTSVVIHADGHATVTVNHGYFAAWWPITRGNTPATARYDLILRNGQILPNHKLLD